MYATTWATLLGYDVIKESQKVSYACSTLDLIWIWIDTRGVVAMADMQAPLPQASILGGMVAPYIVVLERGVLSFNSSHSLEYSVLSMSINGRRKASAISLRNVSYFFSLN